MWKRITKLSSKKKNLKLLFKGCLEKYPNKRIAAEGLFKVQFLEKEC